MSKEVPASPPPNNKKKRMLLVGVGAVVALAAAGGGLWASGMLGGAEGSHETGAEEGGHGEPAASGHGEPAAAGHGEPAAAGHDARRTGHVSSDGASKLADGMADNAGPSSITNLGAFTTNLRGSGGGRVLRMEVQVDSPTTVADKVTQRLPELRDSVLTAVGDYTWSELEGVDGKTRLRDELLVRLNGVLAPHAIDRVYFTQFVVQ